LNRFYRFAITRGLVKRSPLPKQSPKVATSFAPHIYTEEELRRLLEAVTSERTRSLSPVAMRTLLLLLYGAGLRLSEALNLDDGDVDLRESVLWVRRSKFFKTRLVPIGPKLTKVLAEYERQRPSARGSHRRFFRTKTGARLDCSLVGKVFRDLRRAAGLEQADRRNQPRLHDLRHSMATHRLLSWYREGADVQALLPQLSAYLGHADIANTQVYLTNTPELREQASRRFARYAWGDSHE
jgi:site-specific recombinase XerD